jgi:hypothetical protein
MVKNNVIADAPKAAEFFMRADGADNKATQWMLEAYDRFAGVNNVKWNRLATQGYNTQAWADKYKDNASGSAEPWATLWAPLYDYVNLSDKAALDLTYGALNATAGFYSALYGTAPYAGTKEALGYWAYTRAPSAANGADNLNKFEDNVLVKAGAYGGRAHAQRNYSNASDFGIFTGGSAIGAAEKPKAADFKLTPDGLAAVRSAAAQFADINDEIDKIGLIPLNQQGALPGGREPGVSDASLRLSGQGRKLTADYTYSDPDGVKAGAMKYVWYQSDAAGGTYTKISGKQDKELILTQALNGKYIKCEVTPYNANALYGDSTASNPFQAPEAPAAEITRITTNGSDKASVSYTAGQIGDRLIAAFYGAGKLLGVKIHPIERAEGEFSNIEIYAGADKITCMIWSGFAAVSPRRQSETLVKSGTWPTS